MSEEAKIGKCCLINFITPADFYEDGALPTFVILRLVDNKPHVILFPEAWKIMAVFDNKEPCNSDCCQYRQYIQGRIRITLQDGTEINGGPVTGYQEVADESNVANKNDLIESDGKKLLKIKGLQEDQFIEDSVADPNWPGHLYHYGHKPSDNPFEAYIKNGYWCVDHPNTVVPAVKGIVIDIDMTFQGQIIDVCNQANVIARSTWNWTQNYTVE